MPKGGVGKTEAPVVEDASMRAVRVGSFLAWWVALAGLWLALDYTLVVPELVAGAVAAGLGAGAAVAARVRFRIAPRWLRLAWRPAAQMLPDTAVLIVALWGRLVLRRQPDGSLRVLRFDAGGAGAADAARRGLAEGAGSFAPNTYVIGVDRDADVIVVHQLVATRRRVDADPLELG